MVEIPNYFEQVYAGVLGKVIGVYMGRPFEGWRREDIERRWGLVDRYVHGDLGQPLVVADDDISGTFTFVRALEDSGLGKETPAAFFGDTWLNYLIENRTILWWGGVGYSTEHTAYARLKRGIRAPESGSAALNGRVVSEQIGAQIFIDAIGLVCPGRPELAMALAKRAASVSHDGEAVIGAQVVAAMVAMAFLDKDIHSILDRAAAMIPPGSLIAKVHRDVRSWVREDGDWRATFRRIEEKYGYDKFGGGCHMIPNHAVMVMAWEYAGNDFRLAQTIANSAGWDTDCNAANVGTVSALIAGLGGIDASYGFHSHPEFADRMVLPTADGTDSVTDCLLTARRIARLGCSICGLPVPDGVESPFWHDFALPGALHGYIAETPEAEVSYSPLSGGSARIDFTAGPSRPAIVSTPLSGDALKSGNYAVVSTPPLYHGTELAAEIACDRLDGSASLCLEVLCPALPGGQGPKTFRSPPLALEAGKAGTVKWTVDCERRLPSALRVVLASDSGAKGSVRLCRVALGGRAEAAATAKTFGNAAPAAIPGWICTMGAIGKWGRFAVDCGTGLLVTGNRSWHGVTVSARLDIHCAERAGIVLDYQGLRRHHAVFLSHGRLVVARNLYGETVLCDVPSGISEDETVELEATSSDGVITVRLDGAVVAEVPDPALACGGAGLFVEEGCFSLVGEMRISADLRNPVR